MKIQGDIFKGAKAGELTTFDGAFPTIQTVEVFIKESGEGNDGLGLRALTRRSVRETINCSNPRCFGKGLDLGGLLRQMLQAGETTRSLETPCGSREENGTSCPNVFHVEVTLTLQG